MCCLPASRHTREFVRACMFGWVWIGALHIRRARCLCPCAVMSVSGSRSNFDFMFSENNKEDTMEIRKLALLILWVPLVAPVSLAQIKHVEMRVEGMT